MTRDRGSVRAPLLGSQSETVVGQRLAAKRNPPDALPCVRISGPLFPGFWEQQSDPATLSTGPAPPPALESAGPRRPPADFPRLRLVEQAELGRSLRLF